MPLGFILFIWLIQIAVVYIPVFAVMRKQKPRLTNRSRGMVVGLLLITTLLGAVTIVWPELPGPTDFISWAFRGWT
ncbi:hypothetical protein [Aureibacillus halotolerans]|uniref:Uncharacterized protein n=1 Tax=Aureibacillus halotolerans TaxID=1508390 RepID=A0A4R6U6S0_9BACI|nr:hypothetical protein [Aureibacillus halotolerans]TDQ41991.1 hypothetical protein EV213_10219 [Aureibacillus halotolerans]